MAKIISQETFNDVVKENIVEFSMTSAEALDETIKQFEAQGINLANIIKNLSINEETGIPMLNETVTQLKDFVSGTCTMENDDLIECLSIVEEECKKSIPHRVLAGKIGTLEVLLMIIEKKLSTPDDCQIEILRKCITAANALLKHQPDIFDAETLLIAIKILETKNDVQLICDVLQLIIKACIMHETNRQNIMNVDIMTHLQPLLSHDQDCIIKYVCQLFRCLILDDDIRVEFGKAHEHAKIIASLVLTELTKLLIKFKSNENLLADIMLTIASLCVRNEFCLVVEEADGLKYIVDIMKDHISSSKLIKEAFKLLRALAGNDTVKLHLMQQGISPIIEDALDTHKSDALLAKFGLVCISTLALRSIENSKTLFECGIAETILETMKLHPTDKNVLRNGSWAIRNMVCRSKYQCETFINHGAEDVLNAAMKAHPSVEQDIKSALRDLDCKCNLKEEWTETSSVIIGRD